MSGKGEGAFAGPGGDRRTPERRARAQGMDIGWTVSGYLFSGMLAYGIIGWLIGRAVHAPLLLPIGMLVGLAISIGFIIYRYGVQAAAQPGASAQAQKEMTGDR
jgi:F0F1-type ATP synthase assembly protein I